MFFAPAVDPEGRLLVCVQKKLVALAEGDGEPEVLWEYFIGSHVPGPAVIGPDGNIRVHSNDGLLHCVTPSGRQAWAPAQVEEPLGWAAPVCDAAANTWISAYDGGLIKVGPEGQVEPHRFFRTRQKFDCPGIVHDGVLYIGSEDGFLFAIELTGRVGTNRWDPLADEGNAGWFINAAPALKRDGTIVVASQDDNLCGFNPQGTKVWNVKVPGRMLGSPVLDRYGHVYVGVSQARRGHQGRGMLVSVDGNSYKIRWQYDAAGPVESTPVIGSDGVVYFGDNAGVMHAVDLAGNPKWTAALDIPVRSAGTLIAPGRLAFGLDDEMLVALQCSSPAMDDEGWPKYLRTPSQSGLTSSQ